MSPPEPENANSINPYTVGWICALEEEYECACRMLDEEFTGPEIDNKDDNTYVYGRIAKHHVVIGCLPSGRYGTNSAARVARDMVRSFPHLRFALMVGIGGGAPTEDSDIRLGDIVVSQPRDGFGGVVQYDFGKKLQNGEFQQTGQLNAPPEKLLGVLPEIRRLYNDKRKPDRIDEHLQRMDDMEDYQRPMLDRLYRTDYQHIGGKNCGQCDPNRIVERPERRGHRTVAVHYGTIASGNTVMKDATVRDLYAKDPELNVLCFEMEAAGLMNSLPCLVIRGICDYCDSHKNDDWHKYAALTAAAYARELLLVLKPQRVEVMPSWAERVVGELQQVRQDVTTIINSQSTIKNRVDVIDQKIDWAKLPIAEGASYGSYADQHEEECLPSTRIELLRQIADWAMSPQGKCIFWLNGMAGTGKSTISRTVAKFFKEKGLLGASFFFKIGEGDRGKATRLFPTITKQLMDNIPDLIPRTRETIKNDPEIAAKSLQEQFAKLLLQPLLELKRSNHQSLTMVIVIDGLDECEQDNDIRVILQLLPQVHVSNTVHLRFFLTSRPELPIRLALKNITNDHQDVVLHEIPEPVIEQDISLFLNHRLSEIRRDRSLPLDWPGDVNLQNLLEMSVPLFIFAATVCRIFEDPQWDPIDSLGEVLTHQSEESKLNGMYLPIVNRLVAKQSESKKNQLIQEFREVVGAIIILQSPLSVISLSKLIGMSKRLIDIRLGSLHSVLSVPNDDTIPVRLLHLSFRDFLLDLKSREKSLFWVDEKEMHHRLTIQCLEVMHRSLKKNICNLPLDGTQRTEIDIHSINQHLPSELQYSCRYWAHHLVQSKNPVTRMDDAFLFLEEHFLHWVEAMSILGIISEVVGAINMLQSVIQDDKNSEILKFLHDAKRFMLKNRQMANMVPLQLYSSGLIFAPRMAIIRDKFHRELPSWLCRLPKTEEIWSAELQTLESHSDPVSSVAFSPNGRLLASGSSDKTVKLWDSTTGALQETLRCHSGGVCSVMFSSDSQLLASGSYDSTVKLWNTTTGALQQSLEINSGAVYSVAFSPDGRLLASGSDGMVELWDTTTGAQQTLKGHSNLVHSIAFSPDSRLLASGSYDKTVKLWDTTTGAMQQTLKGHLGLIYSIAFSPDGRLLASGSSDETVKLWDTTSGALQETLKCHSGRVWSVIFSPDSRLLASGSDGMVELWDTATGTVQQTLKGHSNTVQSVAFSPDSRLLASGSYDKTVKLWDTATGVVQQTLKGHLGKVYSVMFSTNGLLLASGSSDKTVKLWNTPTRSVQQTFSGHLGAVYSIIFSPDTRLLASGSYDKTIKLWNTTTGALQQTLEGHSGAVYSVVFSPDSRLLASGSSDKTIKFWDITTGALQQTLKGHWGAVNSVVFSLDGRLLASGSNDRTVKLWDTATGVVQRTLKGHSGLVDSVAFEGHRAAVHSVAFSPDGRLLASGSDDRMVKLWDTATGAVQQTLKGHLGAVYSVTFSSDAQLLASSSDDRTVKLWNTTTGAIKQTLEGHSGPVYSAAFSRDDQLLMSGSNDTTLKLWDIATGAMQQAPEFHSRRVDSVTFSPDGRLLASGSETVKLWDSATGSLQRTLECDSIGIQSVAFSPDGRLLASGERAESGYGGTVELWDTATGAKQQTLMGHFSSVDSLAFSPDGRLLASGSKDRMVKLWDTATGALQRTFKGHSERVYSVTFSPDSRLLASGSAGSLQRALKDHLGPVYSVTFSPHCRLLASGSETVKLWDTVTGALQQTFEGNSANDGTVKLWDTATGAVQQTLKGHSRRVHSVAFSPDGRLLASGSEDRTVKLWDTVTGALLQTLTIEGVVTKLAFLADSPYLNTNLGFVNIQQSYERYISGSHKRNVEVFILDDEWVALRGKKVLWLPPEYRPICSAAKDSGTLALGHVSGRVTFIAFRT